MTSGQARMDMVSQAVSTRTNMAARSLKDLCPMQTRLAIRTSLGKGTSPRRDRYNNRLPQARPINTRAVYQTLGVTIMEEKEVVDSTV